MSQTTTLNDKSAAAETIAVIMPPNWWAIKLGDTGAVKARIRDIAVRRLGREEKYAQARAEIRRDLEQGCAAATDLGFTQVVVFAMDIADISVTGSMMNRVNSAVEADSADQLSEAIQRSMPQASVSNESFAGGWLVRSVTETPLRRIDSAGKPMLPELRVHYWVYKHDLGCVVEYVFMTPFIPLKDALLEMFDYVSLSIHHPVRG